MNAEAANDIRCLASQATHDLMEAGDAVQLDLLKQMVDAAHARVIEQRKVPPYPSYGMGGGSQREMRAQDQWESQYGPPPGEPGSRVAKLANGTLVRKV